MKTFFSVLVLLNMSFFAYQTLANELVISNGYIKETPPGAINSAAYFTIKNPTEKTLNIIGAESDIASTVELHNHVKRKGGLVVMNKVKSISIAPKSQFELKPGGHHIMIIGATQPIKKNSTKTITLIFDNNHTQSVELPVIGLKETLEKAHSQH